MHGQLAGIGMKIKVIYKDDKSEMVDPCLLNDLIASNAIKMFLRSDGWANVATSPTRGMGGSYNGIERRKGESENLSRQTKAPS
jgi:hypothetical protein